MVPGLSLPSMGDVVSSHLDEAKREIVAGEDLFLRVCVEMWGFTLLTVWFRQVNRLLDPD